jgi:AraC-like DNA-binding protein
MSYSRTESRLAFHSFVIASSGVERQQVAYSAGAAYKFAVSNIPLLAWDGADADVRAKDGARWTCANLRRNFAHVSAEVATDSFSIASDQDSGFDAQAPQLASVRQEGRWDVASNADESCAVDDSAFSPVITAIIDALAGNPALSGAEFAQSYPISLSQLVRLFKSQVGVSIVEYRNQLRLDRFWKYTIEGQTNLMKASQDAGFGSYAQFHRVFRKRYGDTPRVALQRRPSEAKPDRKD